MALFFDDISYSYTSTMKSSYKVGLRTPLNPTLDQLYLG